MDEKTFLDNKRLIHFCCKPYIKMAMKIGWDYDDLFQLGSMGLVKASDNFKEEKGYSFSTYAVPKIKGEIRRFIRDWNIGAKVNRITKETSVKIYQTNNWENMSLKELSKIIGEEETIIKEALVFIKNGQPSSMNQSLFDSEKSNISDLFPITEDYTDMFVEEFLKRLEEKDQVIVNGLMKGETQREIAKNIGVTQVQVSRRIKKKIQPELNAYIYKEEQQ